MTAYFGFLVTDLAPDTAKELKVEVGRGVFVARVEQDSPADFAGMLVGDVVSAVDGTPIGSVAALTQIAGRFEGDRQVILTVVRDEQIVTTPFTPVEISGAVGGALKPGLAGALLFNLDFGMQIAMPGLFGGIVVADVVAGSPAERNGVKINDIIVGVNGADISSVSEFLFEGKRAPAAVAIAVMRDGAKRELNLQ